MDSLPYEMIKLIISYVDKNSMIIVSFVCKLYQNILLDIYKHKILNINGIQNNSCSCNMIEIQNDSYIFNICCNKFKLNDIFKKLDISKMYSHNCLNRLCLKLKIDGYYHGSTSGQLLIQNCIVNNISKPEYNKGLLSTNVIKDKMLNISLINKSFDMANFCIAMGALPNVWIECIATREITQNEYLKISDELNYLIINNAINLAYFYLICKEHCKNPIYNVLLKYLEPYVSDNVKQYL